MAEVIITLEDQELAEAGRFIFEQNDDAASTQTGATAEAISGEATLENDSRITPDTIIMNAGDAAAADATSANDGANPEIRRKASASETSPEQNAEGQAELASGAESQATATLPATMVPATTPIPFTLRSRPQPSRASSPNASAPQSMR